MARCGSCGGGRSAHSTARLGVGPETRSGVPRVAEIAPIRYIVNGKRFATLTAAQDFARTKPGAVIKQQ